MELDADLGSGFPRVSRDASRDIEKVRRRMNLERELRRGLGRASLPQLEILADTLRGFELSTSPETPTDDSVPSGVHFEGDFGGYRA
jgi:hypothetical protein